jgi:hypothetical protein
VEHSFQPAARVRIGKRELAHPGSVQAAVGSHDVGPEHRCERRHGGSACGGEPARDGIAVHEVGAAANQQRGDGALAAADSAGQPDAHGALNSSRARAAP